MISEQRLHQEAHRIREIVFTKSFYARELQNFFIFDLLFLKCWLLQNLHQDFERLIYLSTQPIDDISEEIRFIDDLNARAGIFKTPGNIFGIESLSAEIGRAS